MENLAPMPMVPSQHQHDHTMTPEVQPSHPSMGRVPAIVGHGMIGTWPLLLERMRPLPRSINMSLYHKGNDRPKQVQQKPNQETTTRRN
jgi:hypothetical protein